MTVATCNPLWHPPGWLLFPTKLLPGLPQFRSEATVGRQLKQIKSLVAAIVTPVIDTDDNPGNKPTDLGN